MNAITPAPKPSSTATPMSTSRVNRAYGGFSLNAHVVIFSLATVLALATASECRSITHLPSLLYGIVLWEWWGCIASVLWALGQSRLSSFSPKVVATHALTAPLLGLVHLLLLGSLGFTVEQWQTHGTALSVWLHHLDINRFGLELLIYLCVVGVIGLVQFQIRAQRDALKASELQRQLSVAQLQTLQSQMEPHFLFNTLNAVTSLVDLGRNREASETLAHLDTILRTTLRRRAPEKVPFTEELRVIESYLAIQQVRFSDRLQVKIHASDEARAGMIPCFLLQPIVENAVKHGIAPMAKGGQIEAEVKRIDDSLWIQVRDTGKGIGLAESQGYGIGMQNTRDRLAHFYPEEHQFTAGPMPSGGFEVTIQIPYERAAV
jgi:signal transduction histidine kinase